jgi:hypothetical protein
MVEPIISKTISPLHWDHKHRRKGFMSKHQPYKGINKYIISERSLNYILHPVQARKNSYPYTYNIDNFGEELSVTVDRAWTYANHIFLDFIGHELYEKYYRKVVKKRNTWRNEFSESLLYNADKLVEYSAIQIPEELKQYYTKYVEYKSCSKISEETASLLFQAEFNNNHKEKAEYEKRYRNSEYRMDEIRKELGISLINELDIAYSKSNRSMTAYVVEIKMSKLIKRYNKYFRKRRKEYLLKLINRTSDVRFTFEYPLKVPVLQEKITQQKTIKKIVTTQFENVSIKNDNIFNYDFHDNTIKVAFNTFFGAAYAHNLLTLNTDWFEENYLKLNNMASALYRRFFVTKPGNKAERIDIRDLVKYFGLINNSRYPQLIDNAFEDIKNAGLIESYKYIINGGKFSKGHIEVVKSSK